MFNSFTDKKFQNRKSDSDINLKDLADDSRVLKQKIKNEKKIILISGPTGVGKSDFAEYLVDCLHGNASIINGDMGQMYTPLSIGTAKPQNINNSYLFNIIDQPIDLSVYTFRSRVFDSLHECWCAGKLPIIVGGSGFYLKSLFYPPMSYDNDKDSGHMIMFEFKDVSTQMLYSKLKEIDADRASKIHPNDRYRIERALFLWKKTELVPSKLKPDYEPLGPSFFYFLTRERQELRDRIFSRVGKMLMSGWIDEVKMLDHGWRQFLMKKKLIGYPEIIQYLEQKTGDLTELQEKIGYKTAQYAKRQRTFWKFMSKVLRDSDPYGHYIKNIQEFNLTNNFECLKDIIIKHITEN